MHPRPSRLALAIALAIALAFIASAHAQTSSSSNTAQQSESAQLGSAPPQQLAPVFVTATPLGSDLFDLVAPATVLQGQGLRLKQQSTLGETLGNEVGISSTYFGPNASRPVIRGLDGDRIRVLQNGVGTIDASSTSFDHAVSIEPLMVERVEVVRGPAALMYGGNAVGGVVNVIDGRIPQEGLSKPVNGAVDLRYGSANIERAGAARLDVGNDRLVVHADAFSRENKDLKIPDYQRSARLRASEPLAPGEEERRGTLPNSAAKTDGGALGASLIFGDKGYTGLSYQQYDSEYGTVAEEDVRIHMRQERWDLAGELRELAPLIKGLKYKVGYSDYQHQEVEGGAIGTTFKNKGYDSRVELAHGKLGVVDGAIGVQATNFEFQALGDEAFLPSTTTDNLAGFIYEELQLGERAGRAKLSFGARVERSKVDAAAFAATGAAADSRRFTPKSGSAGVFYPFGSQYGVAVNAAYTERAPTFQELYADGPHLATDAFEIGDRNLGKEKSTAFDASLRKQGDDWSGHVGAFYNRFKNYVGLLPSIDPATGLPLFRDADDRSLPATTDPSAAGFAHAVQQFVYSGVPAEFKGLEAQAKFKVWQTAGQRVDVELRGDYTRARNRDTGEALPRIAPLRYGGALVYARDRLGARLDVLRAEKQDKVPEGILPTDAYTMVNVAVTYRLNLTGVQWEAFLQGLNLLDEDARLATSFLKDIAPLGKRAVVIGLRGAF